MARNRVVNKMNVVITMAGLGKRFRDAGYDCSKYEIVAHGSTLFYWSMLSLKSFIDAGANFIFVVRKEDQATNFIIEQSKLAGIVSSQIIEIDKLTDGQATTAFLAGKTVTNPSLPFVVYNIDTFVLPTALSVDSISGEGWIPCFPGKGDGWSFALTDANNKVIDLKEKVRISEHATIGLYWFSSFSLYERIYNEYYSDLSNLEKGEKYIAPMYRSMIEKGMNVFIHNVPYNAVFPLGKPQELDFFNSLEKPTV